jgi:exodeoxyribonuclease-3
MKIVTFNVNGIRARFHQLSALVEAHSPDIIGLQECKVDDSQFPVEVIQDLGYQVSFHGQKGHYGVALMSKKPANNIQKGFLHDDSNAQKRFILGEYQLANNKTIKVINGYFPQGESRKHPTKFPAKEKFYQDLMDFLNNHCSKDDFLIIMGDFNISHTDFDIGIGADNAKRWLSTGKCSFLPEERVWFNTLMNWGLKDCFREFNPESNDFFSWFDYRSRGFDREPKRGLRIDGILATDSLFAHCQDIQIDYNIRGMERPSDHAPVIAEFKI